MNSFYQVVEIAEAGVYMGGYAGSMYILPVNSGGMNLPFFKQLRIHFFGLPAINTKSGNGATVFGFKGGIKLKLRVFQGLFALIVFQKAQALFLPFTANQVMKINSIANSH